MSVKKTFAIWLTAATLAFAAHASVVRFAGHPRKVLIVIDASYPMARDWDKALEAVQGLSGKKNERYAVATEKGLVHGYAEAPAVGTVTPYAPRDLSGLSKHLPQEATTADEIVLVTNADAAEAALSGISKIVTIR